MKNKLLVFVISLAILAGCTKHFNNKSAEEFKSIIDSDQDITILDVRTPEEFAQNHLQDAINLNVHASNFNDEIDKLDKSNPILVYCKSGARSSKAAEILVNNGFSEVYNLEGGILQWELKDLPLALEKKDIKTKFTLDEYNEVVTGNNLVLVDFYADWCGPCKMMAPHIKTVKEKYGDKLTILKVNTDYSLEVGKHFNITGIPLVKLYSNGEQVYDRVGYHSEEELEEVLKNYL